MEAHQEAPSDTPVPLRGHREASTSLAQVTPSTSQFAEQEHPTPAPAIALPRHGRQPQPHEEERREEVGGRIRDEDALRAHELEEDPAHEGPEREHRAPGHCRQGIGGVEVLATDHPGDAGGVGGVVERTEGHLEDEHRVEGGQVLGSVDEQEREDDERSEDVRGDHGPAPREAIRDGPCDGADERGRQEPESQLEAEEHPDRPVVAVVADEGQDRHAVQPVARGRDDLGQPEPAKGGVAPEEGPHVRWASGSDDLGEGGGDPVEGEGDLVLLDDQGHPETDRLGPAGQHHQRALDQQAQEVVPSLRGVAGERGQAANATDVGDAPAIAGDLTEALDELLTASGHVLVEHLLDDLDERFERTMSTRLEQVELIRELRMKTFSGTSSRVDRRRRRRPAPSCRATTSGATPFCSQSHGVRSRKPVCTSSNTSSASC